MEMQAVNAQGVANSPLRNRTCPLIAIKTTPIDPVARR